MNIKREPGRSFQVDLQVDLAQNQLESTWNLYGNYRVFGLFFSFIVPVSSQP